MAADHGSQRACAVPSITGRSSSAASLARSSARSRAAAAPLGESPAIAPRLALTRRVESWLREPRTRGLRGDRFAGACCPLSDSLPLGDHRLLDPTRGVVEMHLAHRRVAPALAALGFALSASPAHAALSAVGPLDPATSAPAFYTDANGLQLALCHPGTANCGPAVPGEDFYNMATSTFTMPNGGTAMLILNMTLAPNASGDPAAFNRVRVQLDGAPAGTYTITHPYGTATVTAPGGARGRTTIDIGCAVTAVGPCDFAAAMGGRYGPFLTAAPGALAPPAGF